MSARDTRRDLGAGPNDTFRELPRAVREPDDTSATQEVATREVPSQRRTAEPAPADEETTGARKKFDPYRFQANTVPPGMRAELLQAEPEEHPSDLMQDTVPPNRAAARAPRDPAPAELEGASGFHHRSGRPGLRPVAVVSLALAAIALAVLVIVAATRPRPVVRDAPAPSIANTATPATDTAPSAASTASSAATTAPNVVPTARALPSGEPVPAAREAPRAVPRAPTPPKKTTAPKADSATHSSRIQKGPDLESPLMP